MSDDFLTATHEAGHAVACFLLGGIVERASIERDGNSLGHITHYVDDLLLTIDGHIRITLAGPAARRAADVQTGFLDDGGGSPDIEGSDEWQADAQLQRFLVDIRGVGGDIDVATITRTEGFRAIQQKEIVGERYEF